MKFLSIGLSCIMAGQLGGAQTAPATLPKPALDSLPVATVQFKAIGEDIAVSPQDLFLGYPFCSADGTTYLNARLPPDYAEQSLIGLSPDGKLSSTRLAGPGLVNVTVLAVDARGSDVYALVSAEKAEALRSHDIAPGSSDARMASQYYQDYILHFAHDLAAPDEIALSIPFQPLQFAATSQDTFTIFGLDQANQLPVIAVVDGSGQLVRELDSNGSFGSAGEITANAPQQLRSQFGWVPEAELAFVLSAAQLIHYDDALLVLMPGSNAKVITIRSDGEVKGTRLRLPKGIEAESLVSSDKNWFVRVSDGATNGNTMLVMADPDDGEILKVIRSAQFSVNDITCIHDGGYFAIHWAGEKGSEKLSLMRAAP